METLQITAADGTAEAHLARPDGGGEHPGVLLLIDAIGLRPQIDTMMQRIASWGFVVLAPNTLYRSGTAAETSPTTDLRRPGQREAFFEHAMPRVGTLMQADVAGDLAAYVATLTDLDGVAGDRVGVTGYCMGARMALVAGCTLPQVAAVGGWHGGGLAAEDEHSPHRGLGAARAAFSFGHAQDDSSNPPEAVARLGAALEAAGLEHRNEVFPGPHGYTMADTSMYSPEADARHWSALEALLRGSL